MASGSFSQNDGPVANINVTPLVDVMLVLLVIFMVTTPMMQQGVEIKLPKATNAPLEGKDEQIVMSIDKSGVVFLGAGNKVPLEAITEKVRAVFANRALEDRKIYLKADTGLSYGVLMDVMGRVHSAGITNIGLVSAPLDQARSNQQHLSSQNGSSQNSNETRSAR